MRESSERSSGRVAEGPLLALSLACTAIAGTFVAAGNYGAAPFIAWGVSLAAAFPLARNGRGPRLHGRDLGVLAGVTGLAAAFRLYRILAIPAGLWVDEAATAANAITLAKGPFLPFASTPLFADAPYWVHTSNLYLYAVQLVLRAGHYSQLSVKLISVLPGIAAAPLLYLLARRLMPRLPAATAAGLMAVSQWHVTVSRWGWDEVLVTALAIATFAALHDGVTAERPTRCHTAGILAGLALYGYIASRMLLLGAVLFLLTETLVRRRRRDLAAMGWFVVGSLQASLPLLLYWASHPSVFTARMSEVSIVGRSLAGDWHVLLVNLAAYLGMFHLRGDLNPRQNVPGAPMLDVVTGVLFAAGLVVALLRWRGIGSRLALSWLGAGLLGGILSNLEAGPNSYRVGLVVPACIILTGMAVGQIEGAIHRLVPTRPWLVPAVAGALVAAVAVSTWSGYFMLRGGDRRFWEANEDGARIGMVRRQVDHALDSGSRVLVDESLGSVSAHLQLDVILPRRRPAARLSWVDATTLSDGDLADGVLFLAPQRWPALPRELRALPARPLRSPFGDEVAVAVSPSPHTSTELSPGGE